MAIPERTLFNDIRKGFHVTDIDAGGRLHGRFEYQKLEKICAEHEQRLAEAEKERDQLRARCGELEGLLKTKNSALKTFGRHYESCRSTYQINGVWGACSCGFDAAYDSTPHLTKEQTTK